MRVYSGPIPSGGPEGRTPLVELVVLCYGVIDSAGSSRLKLPVIGDVEEALPHDSGRSRRQNFYTPSCDCTAAKVRLTFAG